MADSTRYAQTAWLFRPKHEYRVTIEGKPLPCACHAARTPRYTRDRKTGAILFPVRRDPNARHRTRIVRRAAACDAAFLPCAQLGAQVRPPRAPSTFTPRTPVAPSTAYQGRVTRERVPVEGRMVDVALVVA